MKKLVLVLTVITVVFFALPVQAQIKIESLSFTPKEACREDIVTFKCTFSGLVNRLRLLGAEKEPLFVNVYDSTVTVFVRASRSANYLVTVYDAVGGYATDTTSLLVHQCPTADIATLEKDDAFGIYPNPCINEVTVRCVGPSAAILRDITGKSLMCAKGTGSIVFATNGIPSGVYIIDVISVDFMPKSFKLVKQ